MGTQTEAHKPKWDSHSDNLLLFLCVNKHAKTIIAQQLSYLKIKLNAQLYLDFFANWNWSLNIGTEI